MSRQDWTKKYAAMDQWLMVKYEQLPKGEQVGNKPGSAEQEAKRWGGKSIADPASRRL